MLITYGGGSVKRPAYWRSSEALKGLMFREFGGIEPNPSYETLMKAVQLLVRDENIAPPAGQVGGSVLTALNLSPQRRQYGRRRSVAHSGNRRY